MIEVGRRTPRPVDGCECLAPRPVRKRGFVGLSILRPEACAKGYVSGASGTNVAGGPLLAVNSSIYVFRSRFAPIAVVEKPTLRRLPPGYWPGMGIGGPMGACG